MRLPRDLSGRQLAQRLTRLGYVITRQTGSHIRLTTEQHDITIPDHAALRLGTLSSILNVIAEHDQISRDELIPHLFS